MQNGLLYWWASLPTEQWSICQLGIPQSTALAVCQKLCHTSGHFCSQLHVDLLLGTPEQSPHDKVKKHWWQLTEAKQVALGHIKNLEDKHVFDLLPLQPGDRVLEAVNWSPNGNLIYTSLKSNHFADHPVYVIVSEDQQILVLESAVTMCLWCRLPSIALHNPQLSWGKNAAPNPGNFTGVVNATARDNITQSRDSEYTAFFYFRSLRSSCWGCPVCEWWSSRWTAFPFSQNLLYSYNGHSNFERWVDSGTCFPCQGYQSPIVVMYAGFLLFFHTVYGYLLCKGL